MKRSKQLLAAFKENSGYWKLKDKVLNSILWRTRFGRGYGHVV
jgi:hypothetical protein